MEIVTHVLTSEQHLDDGRKKTVRQNIEAASDADLAGLVQVVAGKVDKEEGKGLSTNDYTDEEKSKLGDAFNDCHTHENKDLLDGIASYVSGVEKSQDGKTLTIHQTTGETVSDVSFSGELNRIETVTQNGTPLDIVNKTVEITETVQTVSVNGIELPNDGHNIDIGVASLDGSVTVTSGEHGVDLSTTVYKGDSPINVNEDRISFDYTKAMSMGRIYATVADAVADSANLSVGEYFETNGFNTSGDGGAARYVVSNTGTANGMDIIQLAAGKLATLQIKNDFLYPEQLGYVPGVSANDVGPYISRIIQKNVRHIKLRAREQYYYLINPVTITVPDVFIEGSLDTFSGYSSLIQFVPGVDNTDKKAFIVTHRNFKVTNIIIRDPNNYADSKAFCFSNTDMNTANHFGYAFHRVNVTSFGVGFNIDSPTIKWIFSFTQCKFQDCQIGMYCFGVCHLFYFNQLYISNCKQYGILCEGEQFGWNFVDCNFGTSQNAYSTVYCKRWGLPSNVPQRRGEMNFECCGFETDRAVSNNKGCILYVEDEYELKIGIKNSTFIVTQQKQNQIKDTWMMSFGNQCLVTFDSCTGATYYEYEWDKFIIDPTRPTKKKFGSLRLIHCSGIKAPYYGSDYLPCVQEGVVSLLKFDSSTKLENYEYDESGVQLWNLDNGSVVLKSVNNIVQVVAPQTNVIRIGNDLYNFVIIDGVKWITTNLRYRSYNGVRVYGHEDFGVYYPIADYSEIESILPAGWRIPTDADITSIVGDGSTARAHSLQKLGYTQFPDATNSTGASLVPSGYFSESNKYRTFLWGNKAGSAYRTILCNADSITMSGWSETDATSRLCPLRVCADA